MAMYFLGFGTGGSRAVIIDKNGKVLTSPTEDTLPSHRHISDGRSKIRVTGGGKTVGLKIVARSAV